MVKVLGINRTLFIQQSLPKTLNSCIVRLQSLGHNQNIILNLLSILQNNLTLFSPDLLNPFPFTSLNTLTQNPLNSLIQIILRKLIHLQE
jgi:hypothetical protein